MAIVHHTQKTHTVHALHRRGVHEEPFLIHRAKLFILHVIAHKPRFTLGPTATRAAPRVHAITLLVAPEQSVPFHEPTQFLWERNDILPELGQARAPDRDVIHLHVLQGHKQGLRHRSVHEELCQLLMREVPARIHAVRCTPQCDDVPFCHQPQLPHLLPDVQLTDATSTLVLGRNQEVLIRLHKRRDRVPAGNFDTAHGGTELLLLQQQHLELVMRTIRGVKRREALVAHLAAEQHHTFQDRVHRVRRPQRLLSQDHVILRGAQGERLQGHDDQPGVERRVFLQRPQTLQLLHSLRLHVQDPSAHFPLRLDTLAPFAIPEELLHLFCDLRRDTIPASDEETLNIPMLP